MPEFNETAEERRNRIAALLMLATDQPAHSPTASDAITMGSPSGNTQIALSELSDPDAVNGPSLGPILGGPADPAPSGRNSDLDRQADQTLADMAIGWGMPSSSIDITPGAPGAFDMSGPPGDYGSMPSFEGMGYGLPSMGDFSPSPGPIGPGGALADPGDPGGFAAGFAQGFDMAGAAADGVGGVAGDGGGAGMGGMGGSEGSGSSSDSGGASGSSGVG